ncbi:hypothetical protein Tco_1565499, partial [Tanacetum coccineum]
MELFCFVDDVFDSEYVQVQVMVQQVQNWKHVPTTSRFEASGSLPSNTQLNPKAHNSKAYQPPQSRNENVNVVFTRSGKSYNPPVNPNDQQNNFETPINFNSNDEDEEPA